jgi:cell division protein FtsI (penicillin-binding protein 3)
MRLALVVIFLAMVFQLINVQEFSHRHYASLSASELNQTVSVPAVRGGIYDRNGEVLAESVTKQTVVADPLIIKHPAATADALAPVLGLSNAKLRSELTRHSGFVYLAHRVDDGVATAITSLNLTGINLIPEPQRVQPDGQLALPVVGTVNWNGDGASGLEYQYQTLLAGKAGTKSLMQAPDGVAIPGSGKASVAAQPGSGVELTIDEAVQYVTGTSWPWPICRPPRDRRPREPAPHRALR